MGKPIARTDGICFAFPDVCLTPTPSGDVPIPYPNIAQLSDATGAESVNAGGKPVIIETDEIANSSGGEPGSSGGVQNSAHLAATTFTSASGSVKANGEFIVRQFDTTDQNDGNAVGQVMVGFSTVMVGD
ncbi:PAAR-like domain-containing protein [Cognatishimia sp. MH4019]|uniref:PAAR-like domain-containing protein n=1 Tax=Cognatishimia sp. MH4019 TaxID=2854030 RepID=UPI001CD41C0D|nr:PAAR-like domain-containing protein [Cognatishimia sp. MH4019]